MCKNFLPFLRYQQITGGPNRTVSSGTEGPKRLLTAGSGLLGPFSERRREDALGDRYQVPGRTGEQWKSDGHGWSW